MWVISTLMSLVVVSHAAFLTLGNTDFEGGQVSGNNNPADWITIENHTGAFYAEDWGVGVGYGVTLNLQARGDGNILEQSFLTSEVTADTYGTINVTMDMGTRGNTGLARILDIEIWNVTEGRSLTSETYVFPTTGTGFLERKTFSLSYDNTRAGLVGDEISLKITSNGEGNTWKTTHWIDNIEVTVSLPSTPPSIIRQPQGTTVSESDSYMFSVSVSGTDPLSYQWMKNGTELSGKTASSLSLLNLSSADEGDYSVWITNAYGSVTSLVATLTVVNETEDSDGDGLPNIWETNNGLDPNDDGSINPDNGAEGDPDGDGLPNRDEYFLDSSPNDPNDPDGRAWQARPRKAHIMVIHAHPDDEGIFFGGLLPYVTQVRHLNTILVTMNSDAPGHDPKHRETEMRNAAWEYGLRNHPVFGRFRGHGDLHGGIIPLDNAWDVWDGDITDGVADKNNNGIPDGREVGAYFIAEQIRRYRPEVVATHDVKGEYGHGAHKATSISCTDAIALAADSSVEIEGLPPWQVKKLYLHMHGSGANPAPSVGSKKLFHDFWQEESIGPSGKTPIQVANAGLDFHVSQGRPNVSTCYANGEVRSSWNHACEWWELQITTVGDDTVLPDFIGPNANNVSITYSGWAKGDFFEHVTVFPDSDCDQLADAWELDCFATLSAADPAADDDGDGHDNLYEFMVGLNPKSPDDIDMRITVDQTVEFALPAATGAGYENLERHYQLLFSSDLVDWSAVVAEGIADGSTVVYSIPHERPHGFYRLRIGLE